MFVLFRASFRLIANLIVLPLFHDKDIESNTLVCKIISRLEIKFEEGEKLRNSKYTSENTRVYIFFYPLNRNIIQ